VSARLSVTERSLNGRLALHDVADAEGLCRKVLDEQLRKTHAHLEPLDFEDAVSFLIARAYELSLRYDPSRGLAFSTYCYRILRLRVVDWYRATYGDARFGKQEIRESVHRPAYLDAPVDGHADAASLGETLPAGTGDPAADRLAALGGLLGGGDCQTGEDTKIIRRLAA